MGGQDSFQSLRIQIDQSQTEPFGFTLGSPTSSLGDSLSSLDRDCSVGSGRPQMNRSQSQTYSRSPVSPLSRTLPDTRPRCVAPIKKTDLANMEKNANLLTEWRISALCRDTRNTRQICAGPTTASGSVPTDRDVISSTPWTR